MPVKLSQWLVPCGAQSHVWQFFALMASPKNPGAHSEHASPYVLFIHFRHSPVTESQLSGSFGFMLPEQLQGSHTWPSISGVPKKPAAQDSHLGP